MEASSPKRRRVSWGEPKRVGLAATEEAADPSAKQTRPSFASPTKASMERYNPDILRSREPSPKRRHVAEMAPPSSRRESLPTQRKLFPPSGSQGKGKAVEPPLRAGGRGPSTRRSMGSSEAELPASDTAEAFSTPFGEGGIESTPSKKNAFIQGEKPGPRPLPPPGPEEDILEEPLARSRQRHRNGLFHEFVVPEPELPPTPEHPDPVVSTPPSGIHNTPSRRLKRQRSAADNSSPLKSQLSLAEDDGGDTATTFAPVSLSKTTASIRGHLNTLPKSEEEENLALLKARNHELKNHLAAISKHNQRFSASSPAAAGSSLPDSLLEILSQAVPSVKDKEQQAAALWDEAAHDALFLLPFSKATSSAFTAFPRQVVEDDKPPVSHHPLPFTADTRRFIRTFSNLTLTTRTEALPKKSRDAPLYQKQYIQAESTTPPGLFAFSVAITVNTENQEIEAIDVPHIHPAAVPETRDFIQALTQPKNNSSRAERYNIGIMGIAMAEWLRVAVARAKTWCTLKEELATKEGLEKLVERVQERSHSDDEASNDDLGDDAEGSDGQWPEASEIEAEWPEDEGTDVDFARSAEGTTDTYMSGTEIDAVIFEEEFGRAARAKVKEGARNNGYLLPYLGQMSLDLSVPRLDKDDEDDLDPAHLRVQWKIMFRPTGDAVSDIKLFVSAPAKWHVIDKRGRLAEIPAIFEKLLAGGEEPLNAVRLVAALLAGEKAN
ncbi:hypothetical protein GQ53DRAFT_810131 [Thozetella sp. PMI_491]|nr:hypothetical protein GQ53DRAFT_810131 [Thozetella sp. PMI_491]